MTEILPANTAAPTTEEWTALERQCEVIAKSGLAPKSVSTPEKILTIALKGRELNLPPMQSLSHIHIIEGRPALSAELMVALVQRAGHKLRVLETTSERCVVEGVRADDPEYVTRTGFTLDDAERAGLLGKPAWKHYPAAMLRARAISSLCRFAFADVISGCSYTPEELGAEVDEEGRAIEADPVVVEGETEADEHARLLDEVDALLGRLPEDSGFDAQLARSYAEAKIDNARKAVTRLREILEERGIWGGEAGAHEDPNASINRDQYDYLVRLADELYGDKDGNLDGHEWYEREIGKPFSKLTAEEGRWIAAELLAEFEEQEEANVRFAS
ncbi:MAG: hypothetical protein M3N18_03305 [Actinomycetota bacterium]|nr:hypothetical protein [Actinomycetota bacterium]